MAMETRGKQALEMLDCGRAHAMLPLPNGLLADTRESAQFSLGQVHALAQRRTGAPKGVLTFEAIGYATVSSSLLASCNSTCLLPSCKMNGF